MWQIHRVERSKVLHCTWDCPASRGSRVGGPLGTSKKKDVWSPWFILIYHYSCWDEKLVFSSRSVLEMFNIYENPWGKKGPCGSEVIWSKHKWAFAKPAKCTIAGCKFIHSWIPWSFTPPIPNICDHYPTFMDGKIETINIIKHLLTRLGGLFPQLLVIIHLVWCSSIQPTSG